MRSFIAIKLPLETKNYLSQLQAQLKAAQADVKWVEPENIHLTLKFLGEIDDGQLSGIIEILNALPLKYKGYQAVISCLGCFPKLNFPRVIWVGLKEGGVETEGIVQDLEEKITKIGIPKEERKFSSHITIGRVRTPKNKDKLVKELNKFTERLEGNGLEFEVNKITLLKSTLGPKGPVYDTLHEVNLKTN